MAMPASVSNLDTLCSMYFAPEELDEQREGEGEGEEEIDDGKEAPVSLFLSWERDPI